jgi:hypothetical protein
MLEEGNKLRVFKNRVLRRHLGLRGMVSRDRRKLHGAKLQDF